MSIEVPTGYLHQVPLIRRHDMPGIVCAVRGGPASKPTISRAISLAKENSLAIYFLYVVNLDFLSHTSSSRVHTITQEMEQMGEFILLSAQATASRQEVEAQGVVRHGNVGAEIIKLCNEVEADYLVLGRPRVQDDADAFTHDQLAEFAKTIEAHTKAKVVVTEQDEA
jgi:nucleotide-binding universal stress UspA family protein